MDGMMVYNSPQSLWRLIEEHISPHENEEIRKMLGESLIEQSIDLHQEVELLLDIWRSIREETELKSKSQPAELPEPPEIRDRLTKEILFFIEGVKEKAQLNGFDPEKLVAGHNRNVIDYALKTQNSRCGTPRSTDSSGRETPLIPADNRLYEEAEVKHDVISMNDKLNFLQFDQVVVSLRSHLQKEIEQLLNDIKYIQNCIDTETSLPSSVEREPTLTELKEERSLLEKQLIPDLSTKQNQNILRNNLSSPSSKFKPSQSTPSKTSPLKASHSIGSMIPNIPIVPHKKCIHEQLDYKSSASSSRLKVVPVSKVINRHVEGSRLELTPSPPVSERSVTPPRPSSAMRFRRMVLECREGE